MTFSKQSISNISLNLYIMKKITLLLLTAFLVFNLSAQKGDDKVFFDNAFLISPSYSFQLPMSDMYNSYGFNHNIGLELGYKFKHNWIVSVEGNFLFGSKVKETDLLISLYTSEGSLIGGNGNLEGAALSGRGMNLMTKFGKIIHFNPKMANSGLLLKFGVGYIDHKILIDLKDSNVPQLSKTIRTGYDRFSSGVAFSQYVGLIKLEKKKYLNLSFGVELTEGITKNRRPYDFATGQTLNKTRLDLLIGFKFNWYLPVFMGKSNKNEFYYY